MTAEQIEPPDFERVPIRELRRLRALARMASPEELAAAEDVCPGPSSTNQVRGLADDPRPAGATLWWPPMCRLRADGVTVGAGTALDATPR